MKRHKWKGNICIKCNVARRITSYPHNSRMFAKREYLVDCHWSRFRPECVDITQPVVKYSEEEILKMFTDYTKLEKLVQKQNFEIVDLKSQLALSSSLIDLVMEIPTEAKLLLYAEMNNCHIQLQHSNQQVQQVMPLDHHMDKDRVIEVIKFLKNKLGLC